MQVQRLRDPGPRSWTDKIVQAFRATQLDGILSKDAILTEYINRAPFGGNLVGAGAASWRYFGKPCGDLSLGEAALLAGLPQNPNRLRPDRATEKAARRRHHVLEEMLAAGFINSDQFRQADGEPVGAAWRPLPQEMTHWAWGALPTLAAIAGGHPGAHFRTTIDAVIQGAVWRAASEQLAALSTDGIDSAAVLIVDVPSGDIRAAVSLSDSTPAVDFTRCARSTGSILKPFIYASAFDLKILTPESDLLDSPRAWAGYAPANFDKTFRGRMSAADALAESRNIPAMLVLSKVGIERALGNMEQAGLKTPSASARRYGLSLAIGGAEATPLEVAEAYATLARGGVHQPLRLILDASEHSAAAGAGAEFPRVFPEAICWQTLACLSARPRTESVEGGGAAASLHAAWKTGTSSGLRDAWCAAATPRLVAVVWLGNSGGRGNSALIGQEAAAPLALKLIRMLDRGGPAWPEVAPPEEVPPLAGSNHLSIISPRPAAEYFIDGNVASSNRIALKSAGGDGARRFWFANGQLIATADADQTAWWAAQAGTYEIRVIDETGHGATLKARIR
jgi:penicillin-binding protein 1C